MSHLNNQQMIDALTAMEEACAELRAKLEAREDSTQEWEAVLDSHAELDRQLEQA